MAILTRLLFAATLAATAHGPVAHAQVTEDQAATPEQTIESYGDWSVRCARRDSLPPCDIAQTATDNRTGRQVMMFSIAHAGDRERYGVQMVVPLGVLLSGGVLLRVDDKEDVTGLGYTRCEASGCFIEGMVEPDALAPFRRGEKGVLAVLDGQGNPIAIPLSFKGFTAAVDAMTARNRAWALSRQQSG